jgi:hypothetical protein
MISDNGTWNTKTIDDMVKKENSYSMTIIYKGRNSLSPFCKVINGNDYIIMAPDEVGLHCMKSMPHLEKGSMGTMGCNGARWVRAFL